METRCFTTQQCLLIDTDHQIQDNVKYLKLEDYIAPYFFYTTSTYQFSFLHALHNHEQDLLRLAFAIIESLLNGHQKLLSDIIINQAGRGN